MVVIQFSKDPNLIIFGPTKAHKTPRNPSDSIAFETCGFYNFILAGKWVAKFLRRLLICLSVIIICAEN